MKLASLLVRYLYSFKRLELPGIGIFTMAEDHSLGGSPEEVPQIGFQHVPGLQESAQLVDYISEQTGKMKPLAAADLQSFLDTVKQFLNIGKPYELEGMGALVKSRAGVLHFSPGLQAPESAGVTAQEKEETGEERNAYRDIFYGRKKSRFSRKALTAVLVISGIGLALAGGYIVYKRGDGSGTPQQVTSIAQPAHEENREQSALPVDTPAVNVVPDSPAKIRERKFVLEQAEAKRAFARYQRLKNFQWNVEMETSDSILYTLFVRIASPAYDTMRLADSLRRMNGRPVHIQD